MTAALPFCDVGRRPIASICCSPFVAHDGASSTRGGDAGKIGTTGFRQCPHVQPDRGHSRRISRRARAVECSSYAPAAYGMRL